MVWPIEVLSPWSNQLYSSTRPKYPASSGDVGKWHLTLLGARASVLDQVHPQGLEDVVY